MPGIELNRDLMATGAWQAAAWFAILDLAVTLCACYVAFLIGKVSIIREQNRQRARLRRSYRRASTRISQARENRRRIEPVLRVDGNDAEIIGLDDALAPKGGVE